MYTCRTPLVQDERKGLFGWMEFPLLPALVTGEKGNLNYTRRQKQNKNSLGFGVHK